MCEGKPDLAPSFTAWLGVWFGRHWTEPTVGINKWDLFHGTLEGDSSPPGVQPAGNPEVLTGETKEGSWILVPDSL